MDIFDHCTKQDYWKKSVQIPGLEIIDLKLLSDATGTFTELLRLNDNLETNIFQENIKVRQVNYSQLGPSDVKAFHIHSKQYDIFFVPPDSRVMLKLFPGDAYIDRFQVEDNSVITVILGGYNARVVKIPPGVAHGFMNLDTSLPATIFYFVSEHFSLDPAENDEYRLPSSCVSWDLPTD